VKLKLHWQIFISLAIGIVLGFISRNFGFQDFVVNKIAVLGTIFLRGLRMIIIPLIVSSIISGVTSIGTAESFGRLSLKTLTYYVSTSLFAILTGLILVNLIHPGLGANFGFESLPSDLQANVEKIGDTLLGIIPTNPLASMVRGEMLPTIFFSLVALFCGENKPAGTFPGNVRRPAHRLFYRVVLSHTATNYGFH